MIDAIVLVAATAAGLALGRSLGSSSGVWALYSRDTIATYVVSIAYLWTLSIFALHQTRSFMTRSELACRPGFSAIAAVVVERACVAVHDVLALVEFRSLFDDLPDSLLEPIWHVLSWNVTYILRIGSTAGAVAAVWLVAAMAGCWRPEKSWIDRIGRALGVFWLLVAVVYQLSVRAFPNP